MFARGSDGDADHGCTDAEADSASDAITLFRSNETALPVTNASAECFSNCTTDRATVVSTNRPADGQAVDSADVGTSATTNFVTDRRASTATLSTADSAADRVSDGPAFFDADDGADDIAVAAADYFAPNHITTT